MFGDVINTMPFKALLAHLQHSMLSSASEAHEAMAGRGAIEHMLCMPLNRGHICINFDDPVQPF